MNMAVMTGLGDDVGSVSKVEPCPAPDIRQIAGHNSAVDTEWKPSKQAKLIFAVLMVLSLMVSLDSTVLVPALAVSRFVCQNSDIHFMIAKRILAN